MYPVSGEQQGHSGAVQGICTLTLNSSDELVNACALPGEVEVGLPCLDVGDCAPGLACVHPGECRPYCCGDLEQCPKDTFCQLELLEDDGKGETTVEIPVCAVANNCTLLDDATCPSGLTCSIVRVDGTTSCVKPGQGGLGDPCRCDAGFVCAWALNECYQLCKIGSSNTCPAGYACQGGSSMYPNGFGVCVTN